MYVGDRDTANDVFCQDCGRIADRETLTADGLCEDCVPQSESLNIAKLNDQFRKRVFQHGHPNGKAVMTAGVKALGSMAQAFIFQLVMNYDRFKDGDDPYGEHDFGVIDAIDLPKVYWKIDYDEDSDCEYGTQDKVNAYRVLCIMLASEY